MKDIIKGNDLFLNEHFIDLYEPQSKQRSSSDLLFLPSWYLPEVISLENIWPKSSIWFYFSKSSLSKQTLKGQLFWISYQIAAIFTFCFIHFLENKFSTTKWILFKGHKLIIRANCLEILANYAMLPTIFSKDMKNPQLRGIYTYTRHPLLHQLLSYIPLL